MKRSNTISQVAVKRIPATSVQDNCQENQYDIDIMLCSRKALEREILEREAHRREVLVHEAIEREALAREEQDDGRRYLPPETHRLFEIMSRRGIAFSNLETVERTFRVFAKEFYDLSLCDLVISMRTSDRAFCALHPLKIRAAFRGIKMVARQHRANPSIIWIGPDYLE